MKLQVCSLFGPKVKLENLDDAQLKQVQAFLMAPNGDYNCAEVRCERYEASYDTARQPYMFGLLPKGWNSLRENIWTAMGLAERSYFCYLLDKKDMVHKVRCQFLQDAGQNAKSFLSMLRIGIHSYVQVKLVEGLPARATFPGELCFL